LPKIDTYISLSNGNLSHLLLSQEFTTKGKEN